MTVTILTTTPILTITTLTIFIRMVIITIPMAIVTGIIIDKGTG
jgi:hypothetical protein